MTTKNIVEKDIAGKGDQGLTPAGDRGHGAHLLGRKSLLMGMLTSGFVVASVAKPSSALAGTVKPLLAAPAPYISKWAPAMGYAAGQQVVSPHNDVVAAKVAHTSSAAFATDMAKWSGSCTLDGAGVDVRSYGAIGDGVTLDHAAINAAIMANPGRDIHLTAGSLGTAVYQIDANYAAGNGIRLNQAGTHLVIDHGATIRVNPNALTNYAAVTVTASDCGVSGGSIVGDVGSHTGTTGEWGYGVDIHEGAHRCKVQGVHISKCWGDGIMICDTQNSFISGAKPADVWIIDVVSDGNRRQGMSIVSALRPRVIGGTFMNTAGTAPEDGIDIEPNPGGLQDVIDFSIIGAVMQANAGRGLSVHAQGRTACGTAQGIRSVHNTWEGFSSESTSEVEFVGCMASGNGGYGYTLQTGTTGRNTFTGCTADGNATLGFCVSTLGEVIGCHARNNGWAGFYLCGAGTATGCTATGNNTSDSYYGQFTIEGGTGVRMVGCVSSLGTNTAQPARGFDVKAGSTGSRFMSCDTIGTFSGGAFVDGGTGTSAFPVPGVAKPTGVALTVAGLHAALVSLGLIS